MSWHVSAYILCSSPFLLIFSCHTFSAVFTLPLPLPTVSAGLPEGTKIVRAVGYGASYWSRTARVDTEQEDGSDKTYFLKVLLLSQTLSGPPLYLSPLSPEADLLFLQVADGSNGHSMMQGECESMSTMYKYGPDLVPRPIAWGTFAKDPEVHFFISDFREMDSEVPEMEKLCARLAALHQNSHQSGIKQYGFHVITHNGSIPQDVEWTDSWEEFYARGLRHMLVLEEQAQGPQSDEMKIVLGALFDKVIPRLLRPLETDGRSIVPSIVHGDFWHGNCATDVETNDPLLFDASAFWGHNECKLFWMAVWNELLGLTAIR